MKRVIAFLAIFLAAALPAAATPPRGLAVAPSLLGLGSTNSLSISLLGTDVTLSFEDVTGLNLLSLGVSVQLINPLDPALRARLPAGAGFSALPVLVRIEPPAWGGLSFRGVASIDIHTTLLPYLPASPLRIFSAPLGGQFRDITVDMGPGSYRARSTTGGFSEFLIALDLRSIDQVIATKAGALEDMLDDYEGTMPGSVYDDLEDRLETIQADIASHSWAAAVAEIDAFVDVVEDHSGTDIPNVWRAARDRQNVAGYLRAGALTLRFSLVLKSTL
jgi:hypothetical protein